LVWDGTKRILCVDGEEVADDERQGLAISDTGPNVGSGGKLELAGFFAGLIDEVRVRSASLGAGSTTGRSSRSVPFPVVTSKPGPARNGAPALVRMAAAV
jgi:hypothetical protein